MPLYLEDVGQRCHSCFEIWRISCKTQTNDDFIFHLEHGDDEFKEKRKECEKAKCKDGWRSREGFLLTIKVDERVHCLGVAGGCQRLTFPILLHWAETHKTQLYISSIVQRDFSESCDDLIIVNIFGLNLFTFFLKNNLTMKQTLSWHH